MSKPKLSHVHDSQFIKRIAANAAMSGSWGVVACADDGTVFWANAAAHDLLLSGDSSLTGLRLESCDGAPAKNINGLQQVRVGNGGKKWIFASSSRFEDVDLICFSDASSVADRISALSYQESIWRHAVQSAGQGVWDYNANNVAQFESDEWRNIRGIPLDEPFVDSFEKWMTRLHPDDVAMVCGNLSRYNSGENDQFSYEYREMARSGEYIWILATGRVVERTADGTAVRVIGTDTDITQLKNVEQVRRAEQQGIHNKHVAELEKAHQCTEIARQVAHVMARQDPLTQLQNRRVFSDEIAELSRDGATGAPFAVLVLDLDRFKPVNDLYGHTVGDFILKSAADKLVQAAGSNATVSRLGGDEFGVILRPTGRAIHDAALECARALIGTLCEPVRIGSFEIEIGASVGIALFPEHGHDHLSLFQHADMALYDVKQTRRGRYQLYSAAIGSEAEAKAALESAVRQAIVVDEIVPHFQPIVDLRTKRITTFEVLSRWSSGKFGNVAPDRFIPIIDHFNLMPQLTQSILDKACKAAKAWPERVALSINLSAKEVCDLSTPVRILKVLRRNEYDPAWLKVEVTEQALMHDLDTAKDVINALRKCGIKVMLDDFGAGYAGLGYLRELRFDSIKIDKSFVTNVNRQKESAQIVAAIQTLAKHLDLETVAEGIEDEHVLRFLTRIGCDSGQGYYFSRPVSAADAARVLQATHQPLVKIA